LIGRLKATRKWAKSVIFRLTVVLFRLTRELFRLTVVTRPVSDFNLRYGEVLLRLR